MNSLQKKYIREYYKTVCDEKTYFNGHFSMNLTDAEYDRLYRNMRAHENLKRENITIDEYHDDGIHIFIDNKIVAKILNQYSKRRIQLSYKELKPKLVFV